MTLTKPRGPLLALSGLLLSGLLWLGPLALAGCLAAESPIELAGTTDTTTAPDRIDTGVSGDTNAADSLLDSADLDDTDVTVEIAEVDAVDTNGDARPGCPVAVIDVAPGLEVTPNTLLSLDSSRSYAIDGPVVGIEWEVDQPIGSASTFMPSAFVRNPRIEVNVAGLYRIRLHVYDQYGTRSCVAGEATVFVNPDSGLLVELVWTASAPSTGPTLERSGPDLDLHFVHPLAVGGGDYHGDGVMDGWFDPTFDVFWDNPTPNWARLDPAIDDDPMLVRDGTEGSGPESLAFANPEPDTTYRVGVHVWSDNGYEDIRATLRVYWDGSLVFELGDVVLEARDLWEAAEISVGSMPQASLIKRCEGGTQACATDGDCAGSRCGVAILPGYSSPGFAQP